MYSTDKIFVRRLFNLPEIEAVPNAPGVYAFWHQGVRRCIYVGKSDTLRLRLMQHLEMTSHNDELHKWLQSSFGEVEFSYVLTDPHSTHKFELYYWELLKPSANKVKPATPKGGM